jgi:hypothetical protein
MQQEAAGQMDAALSDQDDDNQADRDGAGE